jgi:hypothetical protein
MAALCTIDAPAPGDRPRAAHAAEERRMRPCWWSGRWPGRRAPTHDRLPWPWWSLPALCLSLLVAELLGPGAVAAAPKRSREALSPCAERPAEEIMASQVPPQPISFYIFPRPPQDSGRGIHWVPTGIQAPEVVDRYLAEARAMRISWLTIINDGTAIGPNDYLVRKAVASKIEPVMRIFTPNGRPIEGDLAEMVRHYRRLGVRYYQLYNEPNLAAENVDGVPNVERYVEQWSAAARVVIINGGYPGIGALSPGGTMDELQFLDATLVRLRERGDLHLLDCAWLALHNYSFNRPIDYVGDQHSFLSFRLYHQIIARRLGRPLPMISTEGGTQIGVAFDPAFPPVSPARQVELVMDAYCYMARPDREPYYFAASYWLIANETGGGPELDWSSQALFRHDDVSPIVFQLRDLPTKLPKVSGATTKPAAKAAPAARPRSVWGWGTRGAWRPLRV